MNQDDLIKYAKEAGCFIAPNDSNKTLYTFFIDELTKFASYTSPPNQDAEIAELKARVKELEDIAKLAKPIITRYHSCLDVDNLTTQMYDRECKNCIKLIDQALANTKKGE